MTVKSKSKTVRKRRKLPKLASLRRKLTERFSRMVRERDMDEPCVSCRRGCVVKEAGHFIPRHKLSTRWHPWNVNGECVHCNRASAGHLVGYSNSISERYGFRALEILAKVSNVLWKPLPDQLERLILACDRPEDYESEWFAVQREFAPELERD